MGNSQMNNFKTVTTLEQGKWKIEIFDDSGNSITSQKNIDEKHIIEIKNKLIEMIKAGKKPA